MARMINKEEIEKRRASVRTKAEAEALSAGLLDATFAICHYNNYRRQFGPFAERPLPIDWGVLRYRFSEGEIDDATHRVIALFRNAYQAGDDIRERRLTDRLRLDYPGFSDNCYEATISQGLFESLW
ncbi:hypothetical protein [Mesorhizobium caraganae]|uniref:hypothetical protein n=1 Tax=Mesorhizobium caraganae TaxID=483206 RepID=UPI003ED01F85